ncbi:MULTISPECIES: hypothetical protein [unclassified Rhizobium]|uniref:hypothetical protein n=1 Tax=unclassified Rhizobium TaxID=2613769 RepID=UPI000271D401|nr:MULTISPECIES: hypothetical protein [unclassified Rhizobium]EJL50349.1 hypothetical protein PMI09_05200 [Rhizobium sp. CF122]MBB3398166.1 hypothetical protein [Rhizobium sp. BK060]MBB4170094.1 hypothetical protein [Rhizobium sp. BK538]TCM72159.1 hypothetical protein EV291_12024 [Rhizobium sp. BK068]
MNRVAAIASAVATLAFADASRAESLDMNTPSGIERTLRSFSGRNLDVRQVYDHGGSGNIGDPKSFAARSVNDIQMIRAAIAVNKPLVHQLNARGVLLGNIVNADQAADGGITVYYR